MIFDALTISGVVAALVSTGLIVGVVRHNDRRRKAGEASDAETFVGQTTNGEHVGG
jgi:hypothetical protein